MSAVKRNALLAALFVLFVVSIAGYCLVPRQMQSSGWTREADALFQVGTILRLYQESGSDKPLVHIAALRKWAKEQNIVNTDSDFWDFRDPDSGIKYDWILLPIGNGRITACAPRSLKFKKAAKAPQRLILNERLRIEFLDEDQFIKIISVLEN